MDHRAGNGITFIQRIIVIFSKRIFRGIWISFASMKKLCKNRKYFQLLQEKKSQFDIKSCCLKHSLNANKLPSSLFIFKRRKKRIYRYIIYQGKLEKRRPTFIYHNRKTFILRIFFFESSCADFFLCVLLFHIVNVQAYLDDDQSRNFQFPLMYNNRKLSFQAYWTSIFSLSHFIGK